VLLRNLEHVSFRFGVLSTGHTIATLLLVGSRFIHVLQNITSSNLVPSVLREMLLLSVENTKQSTDYILSTFSLCDVNREIEQCCCGEWVRILVSKQIFASIYFVF
jgi:hypothetical protein